MSKTIAGGTTSPCPDFTDLLPSASLTSRLGGAVKGIFEIYRTWRALRRAEAKLMALDSRLLRDIGIDRSEISSVLRDRSGERRPSVQIRLAAGF